MRDIWDLRTVSESPADIISEGGIESIGSPEYERSMAVVNAISELRSLALKLCYGIGM